MKRAIAMLVSALALTGCTVKVSSTPTAPLITFTSPKAVGTFAADATTSAEFVRQMHQIDTLSYRFTPAQLTTLGNNVCSMLTTRGVSDAVITDVENYLIKAIPGDDNGGTYSAEAAIVLCPQFQSAYTAALNNSLNN